MSVGESIFFMFCQVDTDVSNQMVPYTKPPKIKKMQKATSNLRKIYERKMIKW